VRKFEDVCPQAFRNEVCADCELLSPVWKVLLCGH